MSCLLLGGISFSPVLIVPFWMNGLTQRLYAYFLIKGKCDLDIWENRM
ncbi:16892_t:CDS:1, partial [Funneliformis geosporum]